MKWFIRRIKTAVLISALLFAGVLNTAAASTSYLLPNEPPAQTLRPSLATPVPVEHPVNGWTRQAQELVARRAQEAEAAAQAERERREREAQQLAAPTSSAGWSASPSSSPSTTASGAGDSDKLYIYLRESCSGCAAPDPAARNAQGCFGIGQDCNGVVEARCGTDYACQDDYFSNEYMPQRYGSWANARAFWVAHGWW